MSGAEESRSGPIPRIGVPTAPADTFAPADAAQALESHVTAALTRKAFTQPIPGELSVESFRRVLGWEQQHVNRLARGLDRRYPLDNTWPRDPVDFHARLLALVSAPGGLEKYESFVVSTDLDIRNSDAKQRDKSCQKYSLYHRWMSRAVDLIVTRGGREGRHPSQVLDSLFEGEGFGCAELSGHLERFPEAADYVSFHKWREVLESKSGEPTFQAPSGPADEAVQQALPQDWIDAVEQMRALAEAMATQADPAQVQELRKLCEVFDEAKALLPASAAALRRKFEEAVETLARSIHALDSAKGFGWVDPSLANDVSARWREEIANASDAGARALLADIERARTESAALCSDYARIGEELADARAAIATLDQELAHTLVGSRRRELRELRTVKRAREDELDVQSQDLEARLFDSFWPWQERPNSESARVDEPANPGATRSGIPPQGAMSDPMAHAVHSELEAAGADLQVKAPAESQPQSQPESEPEPEPESGIVAKTELVSPPERDYEPEFPPDPEDEDAVATDAVATAPASSADRAIEGLLERLHARGVPLDADLDLAGKLQRRWLEMKLPLRAFLLAEEVERHGAAASLLPAWACRLLVLVSDSGVALTDDELNVATSSLYRVRALVDDQKELVVLWLAAELFGAATGKATKITRRVAPAQFGLSPNSLAGKCAEELLNPVFNGASLMPPRHRQDLQRQFDRAVADAEAVIRAACNYQNTMVKNFWRKMTVAGGPMGRVLKAARNGEFPARTLSSNGLVADMAEWDEIIASYRHNIENRLDEFSRSIELARSLHSALEERSRAQVKRASAISIAEGVRREHGDSWWAEALACGLLDEGSRHGD